MITIIGLAMAVCVWIGSGQTAHWSTAVAVRQQAGL